MNKQKAVNRQIDINQSNKQERKNRTNKTKATEATLPLL